MVSATVDGVLMVGVAALVNKALVNEALFPPLVLVCVAVLILVPVVPFKTALWILLALASMVKILLTLVLVKVMVLVQSAASISLLALVSRVSKILLLVKADLLVSLRLRCIVTVLFTRFLAKLMVLVSSVEPLRLAALVSVELMALATLVELFQVPSALVTPSCLPPYTPSDAICSACDGKGLPKTKRFHNAATTHMHMHTSCRGMAKYTP